jgi:site-specific recombinase XerD
MKKVTGEALQLAKYIHDWIRVHATSIRSNSPHTVRRYEVTLSLFVDFLEKEKGINPSSLAGECFSSRYIEEWILWLKNKRNCSGQTCNVRLAAIRVFLKYLAGKDISYLSLYQSATLIPGQNVAREKVTGMSKEAMKTLMSIPDASTKTGQRDLVLLVVLYCTAARIDEILSIKISQLHLNTNKPHITVIGKGRKIRTLYILPKAVAHLKKYLKDFHAAEPNPEAYLFYSRNIGVMGKMTPESVNQQLKKYAAIAHRIYSDVPVDLHAHQIRHAKASHWLEDGMNIVQISFLLGHANLQTTMMYLDITTEQESKALATLEDEDKQNIPKKWKTESDSLAAFLSVRNIVKK